MDIQGIVQQLMEIESRPLQLLQSRIAITQEKQAAYLTLSAQLKAAKVSIGSLGQVFIFNSRSATSSDTNVLTATAANGAAVGSTSFMVRSLVSTHQLVSAGFRDRNSAPVGAGRLVLEPAQANVAPSTALSSLNGANGIRRGVIRVTDRSGATTDIDLNGILTIDDVLDAFNSQNRVAVKARTDGSRLIIEDVSGGTAGDLRIIDLGTGKAAADLGIAQTSATGTIEGSELVALSAATRLSRLNDGIGMRFKNAGADLRFTLANGDSFDVDFRSTLSPTTDLSLLNDGQGVRLGTIRITNRAGQSREVDLTGTTTVQQVINRINATGIKVTATLSGSKLIITDTTEAEASNLKIEDVSGYAAADLGIVTDAANTTREGGEIYRTDTLAAVLRAIEHAEGYQGRLTVSISDKGLVFTDHTGTGGTTVTALNDSLAARDLGLLEGFDANGQLQTRDLIAGLNTVLLASLKGGGGLATGELSFSLRDGTTIGGLDFSQAQTLADVMQVLNATGKLSAEVDSGGTRIRIRDLTTGGASFSASGEMATTLGLASSGDGELLSEDLQLQYVAESTKLSDLNAGKGVVYGSLSITAANGTRKILTLDPDTEKTVGDVIDAINRLAMGVVARINANGDGIELEDTTTGASTLTVTQEGKGSTVADLGLTGTADANGILTGSFAKTIEVSASDTLDSLVTKINSAKANVTASVVSSGAPDAPYQLILTSRSSGSRGQVVFTTDIASLSLDTLAEARDATVVVGDPNSPNAVVVSSSSNTLKNAIPNLTLNLQGTSDRPVTVTVQGDSETIVENVKSFITAFNEIMDKVDELTQYIPDTEEKGILFGESTVRQIESRLFSLVMTTVNRDGMTYNSLSELGIVVDSSSGSARLSLGRTLADGTVVDGEERLREAIETDPESVKKLFSLVEVVKIKGKEKPSYVGIAASLNHELTLLTSYGGVLPEENEVLQSRVDQFDRQAESMQELLDMKEERLYAQFQAMEQALAEIQSQQTALASLTQLAASMSS